MKSLIAVFIMLSTSNAFPQLHDKDGIQIDIERRVDSTVTHQVLLNYAKMLAKINAPLQKRQLNGISQRRQVYPPPGIDKMAEPQHHPSHAPWPPGIDIEIVKPQGHPPGIDKMEEPQYHPSYAQPGIDKMAEPQHHSSYAPWPPGIDIEIVKPQYHPAFAPPGVDSNMAEDQTTALYPTPNCTCNVSMLVSHGFIGDTNGNPIDNCNVPYCEGVCSSSYRYKPVRADMEPIVLEQHKFCQATTTKHLPFFTLCIPYHGSYVNDLNIMIPTRRDCLDKNKTKHFNNIDCM